VSERVSALRVALLAGCLTRGGAEKQLVYMVRALREAGVCVRVYTLGEGEFYEGALRDAGVDPVCVGRSSSRAVRLVTFARALRQFRPHLVQAVHFYVNLYVALAARACGALGIGAIRSDGVLDLEDAGHWGRLSLRAPTALVTNSHAAQRAATRLGINSARIHVVANVIDPSAFDRSGAAQHSADNTAETVVILVGQLIKAKRVDRFLDALALARRSTPKLKGAVVGAGPERWSLEAHAARLGLLPDGMEFRGACDYVPRLMAEAHVLALTSEHEGFPNVILEAMAARLPVVSTPAGDAASIVEDGVSGFVVPCDATEDLADRLIRLARSPTLRHDFGEAGHKRVTTRYACAGLADRLLAVYRAVAQRSGRLHLLERVPTDTGTEARASGRGVNAQP